MAEEINVMSLVEKSDNSAHWGVKDALEHALKKYEQGMPHGKVMIVFLDDSGGKYNARTVNAKLKCSEVAALCEFVKADHILDMLGGEN